MSTQWLTLEEAATEIRLSLRAFRRLVAERKIAVDEINSRVKRVDRHELERFMQSRRTEVLTEVTMRPNCTETGLNYDPAFKRTSRGKYAAS